MGASGTGEDLEEIFAHGSTNFNYASASVEGMLATIPIRTIGICMSLNLLTGHYNIAYTDGQYS